MARNEVVTGTPLCGNIKTLWSISSILDLLPHKWRSSLSQQLPDNDCKWNILDVINELAKKRPGELEEFRNRPLHHWSPIEHVTGLTVDLKWEREETGILTAVKGVIQDIDNGMQHPDEEEEEEEMVGDANGGGM